MHRNRLIEVVLISLTIIGCGQEKTKNASKFPPYSSHGSMPSEAQDQDATEVSSKTSASSGIQVETLVKTTQSWNSSPLPNYNAEHPQMTALRITIPPHTKLPVHRHPVINAGILLEGELTVISEAGDTLHMKKGDPIVEMVNQWHHGENNGAQPAEIVVFYSGNVDVPVTILKDSEDEDQGTHNGNSQESTAPSH